MSSILLKRRCARSDASITSSVNLIRRVRLDQRGKNAIDGKSQHFTGAASELYVSYRLTAKGHQVFLPAFTQSKADLVVDIDGTLTRVQVKTGTKLKNCNSIQVRLGGCGKPTYSPGDIDLLAVVYQDSLWLIPFTEEVRVKTSMCINLTSDKKYGQFKQE